jgi:hypothetical protein
VWDERKMSVYGAPNALYSPSPLFFLFLTVFFPIHGFGVIISLFDPTAQKG